MPVYLPVGMPVYLYVCFSFIARLFGSLSTLRNARKTIQMFSQQLFFCAVFFFLFLKSHSFFSLTFLAKVAIVFPLLVVVVFFFSNFLKFYGENMAFEETSILWLSQV